MSVLFFCVGAAKAGTSWLYSQLAEHPECHFRAIKELHYFDAVDDGKLERELRKHQGQQARILNNVAASGNTPSDDQARRLTDRAAWMDVLEQGEDTEAYLGYLNHDAGDAKVVGDITPGYALLSETRFRTMSKLAGDVRFLMLLRDPVERLWSHVRMIAARRDDSGTATAERCDRILKRTIRGKEDQIAKRSNYAVTIERLMAAVPGGKLLIEVFEEMVSGEGLARICAHLGIAPIVPNLARLHAGQHVAMTQDQRRAAAHWLAPQYEASAKALGRMPEAWMRKGQDDGR
ncbi:MAG: hypothetical protein HKN27_14730 [Silicimonas sp.]|nr:hypothetical protein [Silicimonas sp.]